MAKARILLVDDEVSILKSLTHVLEDEGYEVVSAGSGEEALKIFGDVSPDVTLLDVWLPSMDGIEVLRKIKENDPDAVIIMMSGHGTIDTAVRSTKFGAYDFIEKPLSVDKLDIVIQNALEKKRLEDENRALRGRLIQGYEIVGETPVILELKEQIKIAGPSNGRVLIYGENGTGKELIARQIHFQSDRRDNPFVEVNCAAIPQELIESELFGHEKGSFTGATSMRKGKFELADQGTLFLDEIGDMTLATQAKVLRVLQEQTVQRVGGTKTIEVDVRVIAASNKDLEKEIKEGRFRDDLFYRLNVIPMYMPPLRERPGDIPLLVQYFIHEYAQKNGVRPKEILKEGMNLLMQYDWPGNVRELKNIVERIMIMVQQDTIGPENIPVGIRGAAGRAKVMHYSGTLREARQEFELDYILQKLQENDWNISQTAKVLEIERSNLHRKIKKLGLEEKRSSGMQR
ncbi:MAG: Fis family transcriptional regulator [Nitrospirae bacterium CG_4_9_14_3_um_filter_53_35]|nr:MAG: Fis family transcriptional regulator [Nitrospirae bacterium CG2_30_53_67]PIV83897.1 MAG: Fis family transcriptional regulator [Nitrospirae bacterium CG17_big_fil_post_rev_8_21_14_2_50_50_9]PIW84385.1 MAG: Fis family transcriptional regulator [Nitrospirae bacterium CG_4_8_14_3_um_filter_50_41]PIX86515.1 MAG: Fis family transcriptional regulator [Nitrospirae bacterium CG_4_10_14_3_um_filter_53_41]PJA75554.1 MAG: Fis family transcriptional regulator [Nitrospirae bacterium CG_4_9_14_3_um_fi